MTAEGLTFGLECRDEAYATAMLCVVNAHQSLAAGCVEEEGMPRCQAEVLQTSTFVPIHAPGEEKHAYCRLILSLSIPLS